MKEKVMAKLSIKEAGRMTDKRRKDIAKWLRYQADCMEEAGNSYSDSYTARYIALEGKS